MIEEEVFNNGGICEEEVFKNGRGICTFAAPSVITEPWVIKVREESGQRVDWHYSGGRVNMLYIGDYAKVKAAVEKLLPELTAACREHSVKAYGNAYERMTFPEAFRFFSEESRGLFRKGDLTPAGTIAVDPTEGFIVEAPDDEASP